MPARCAGAIRWDFAILQNRYDRHLPERQVSDTFLPLIANALHDTKPNQKVASPTLRRSSTKRVPIERTRFTVLSGCAWYERLR